MTILELGDVTMPKMTVNILISAVALMIGCAFYVLFRSDSYVSRLLFEDYSIDYSREVANNPLFKIANYYFLDYLWTLAFACALRVVFDEGKITLCVCCGIPFICGCIWELLQYASVVNGTGDFWDVVMYFFAGMSALLLNMKEKNK